jgi:Flp pilus assembly protein TadB
MSNYFRNDWAAQPAQATRWGHAGPQIIVAMIATMAVLAVLPVAYPEGGKPLLSLAFLALMLTTFWEIRKHDRALCERCAADFPLNPAQDAERYQRRLAVVHLMAEPHVARFYLVSVLVVCLLPLLAPDALRVPVMALWLAALGSVGYLVQSGQTHRKLQPWCHQCGHQGGQDKVDTPEPMPMGGLSR